MYGTAPYCPVCQVNSCFCDANKHITTSLLLFALLFLLLVTYSYIILRNLQRLARVRERVIVPYLRLLALHTLLTFIVTLVIRIG
jgi:hypothetical protein